jgi:large repetitive protein
MPILGSQGSQLIRSFLQPLIATINSVSKGASVGQVSVAFTPANSGPAATSFTVTSSPGNITAAGASSPITVSGLTPGTSYTFTVVASNATGNSNPSSASSSIAASQYICPSGGTLSGSNCVTSSSYAATYNAGYYSCGPGASYCTSNAACGITKGNCATLTSGAGCYYIVGCVFGGNRNEGFQSGGSFVSESYTCPSGGTLTGTNCVTTSSYAASIG